LINTVCACWRTITRGIDVTVSEFKPKGRPPAERTLSFLRLIEERSGRWEWIPGDLRRRLRRYVGEGSPYPVTLRGEFACWGTHSQEELPEAPVAVTCPLCGTRKPFREYIVDVRDVALRVQMPAACEPSQGLQGEPLSERDREIAAAVAALKKK
jgi:hypothetical protein